MQNERIILVKTSEDAEALLEYLTDKDYVAFDTETDGLSSTARIVGFSIAAELDVAFYVVLYEWKASESQLVPYETLKQAPAIFEALKSKKLIMHNGVFDCSKVESNFKISLINSLHTDTMILGHLLNENRHNGLKERGYALYGEDATKEQKEMKDSVLKNGGQLTKACYELYKADVDLLGYYGGKDALLTLKLFYNDVEDLYAQGLEKFFYEEESMPLLRGPTYQLNTVGLRVDKERLQVLKRTLESECLEAKAFIAKETAPLVKDKYPGTNKKNVFNIGSSKQLAWLLFFELENEFNTLTEEGRNLAKALNCRMPYSNKDKRDFIAAVTENKGRIYAPSAYNPKTKKMSRPKVVGDPWNYTACGKETLTKLADKYVWVKKYLEYAKNLKLLNTYVLGIESRLEYGVIHPSFLQHGTTSGRYSSRGPNFQNLPRDDKRVKACLTSRPGRSFIGADYLQLEPRVFASFSGDDRLLACFKSGLDFYSVIGAEVFGKTDCSLIKDDNDPNCFANKYKVLRNIAKVVALSATYGTTAPKMAPTIKKSIDESKEVIENYFETFPKVKELMLASHAQAMKNGQVVNLFGRPRRMPEAKNIPKIYGKTSHAELPYDARNILNLSVNHRIQSTGASIMNRAAIRFYKECQERWPGEVTIVMQVHDELIAEAPDHIAEDVRLCLKDCMENTVVLPSVDLCAEPKIAKDIGDLK